ncbi:hypothetical protein BC629DRAFT_1601761 [Irpex lacteus]|nr:hypothetical protein BC629DRAFT_1601761 [Irpex lacteus]
MTPGKSSKGSISSNTLSSAAQTTIASKSTTSISYRGPRLPQELLDLIVGFVDDVDSLVSCWLSSRTLFHNGVKYMLRVRGENYDDILRKLKDHPKKASAVRILSFNARDQEDDSLCRYKDIPELLPYLKNLEHIDIRRHNFKQLTVGHLGFQLNPTIDTSPITRLTLAHTKFMSIRRLLHFIHDFPHVQHLTLDHISWEYDMAPSWPHNEPLLRTPHLLSLRVRRTNNVTNTVTDKKPHPRFLSDVCVQKLETVVISATSPRSVESWWNLWAQDAVYPSLRHLIIRDYTHQGEKNRPPPLPNAPNLRSLTLGDILTQYRNTRILDHGVYIKHFLDSVTSTRVEELVFRFDWDPVMDISALAVADWLPSLCHDKFAGLLRVTYSLRVDAYYRPLEDLREAFTARILSTHEGWNKRNIINIEVFRGVSPPL